MNALERKIALRVLGIHIAVIVFFLLVAGLKGCFRPKPKPEIVTFIEFGQPAPPVAVQQVDELADTEPEPPSPKPEPKPAPVPEPIKKPIPKPKPKPKPEPEPKPEPKPEPEKPKWKPVDPKDIKISDKVVKPKPSKPLVSAAEIQKALSGISSPNAAPTTTPGNPNEHAAYDAHIYSVFYNAWKQPGTPALRPAEVTISISPNGLITKRKLTGPSGDSTFDQTVMEAVNSVSILPRKPPPGYDLDNIVVQFRIIE